MKLLRRLASNRAPAAVLIIRLMVGAVFVSEGTQKFLYPDEVGAGRFAKIGFANPAATAATVACFEIACGALVLAGAMTRLAVIPLATIMVVAIVRTKIPILEDAGLWRMAHDARTDWSMLLGSLFLLLVGAGPISVDAWIARRGLRGES